MAKSQAHKRASPPGEGLGRAIKVIRTAQGLDRKELAERAGLSYPYLAEIEQGKKAPSSKALSALAAALEMRPSELLATADSFFPQNEALNNSQMPSVAPAMAMLASSPAPRSWFSSRKMADLADSSTTSAKRRLIDDLVSTANDLEAEDVRLLLQLAQRLSHSE